MIHHFVIVRTEAAAMYVHRLLSKAFLFLFLIGVSYLGSTLFSPFVVLQYNGADSQDMLHLDLLLSIISNMRLQFLTAVNRLPKHWSILSRYMRSVIHWGYWCVFRCFPFSIANFTLFLVLKISFCFHHSKQP